jgi:hypothetical protein
LFGFSVFGLCAFIAAHGVIWLYNNNRPDGWLGPHATEDKKAAQKVSIGIGIFVGFVAGFYCAS